MAAHQKAEPVTIGVRKAAEANLPTKFGMFRIVGFESNDGKEHSALVLGDVADGEPVVVRVHSECFTGDVMGSLKCDCGDQLEAALQHVQQLGRGVIVYLRQEGRGIGLTNKIRAYSLQDGGMDTVEANHALGFADDLRRFDVAAAMLRELGVSEVELLTNNPRKLDQLSQYGIKVSARTPLKVGRNPFNEGYLDTKRDKSGHLL